MQRVHVLGLGLGPADHTPSMQELIDSAQVLAGGRRLLDWFTGHPARRLELAGPLGAWLDAVQNAARTERVVVLASGDPGFFGVAGALIKRLGRDNVSVVPNISAMQASCARLGLQWGNAAHVSLHSSGGAIGKLWRAMSLYELVSVYTKPGMGPAEIAALLTERGQGGWHMHVLEDIGYDNERTGSYSPEQAADVEFSPLSVVLLERMEQPKPLHLGMHEAAYEHENNLITKAEVRAVALAKLRLEAGMTLWDIGAGSGSLGIEACLLLPGGAVIALEQNPARVKMIEANRARYGAGLLEVIQGRAPEALAGLPAPDRVFIGGGGKDLGRIIKAAASALAPGGIIVVSAVLLKSMEVARAALAAAELQEDETMLQVSRSAPVAGQSMLKSLNPVWLIRGAKSPGELTQ